MNDKLDINFLLSDTRSRVYLVWAFLATFGFVVTHYYQRQQINGAWFLISVLGLGYMYKVMPLRVKQMRNIFLSWAVPITVGMVVSGAVFYSNSKLASNLILHLGAFWLVVMSVGYFLNGLVDPPSKWYWVAAGLNLAAGIICFMVDDLIVSQYLIAAVISAWSMLNLWIFRAG